MKNSSLWKITRRCQNLIFAHNYNPAFLLKKTLVGYISIAIIHLHIKVEFGCFIINWLKNISSVTIDPGYICPRSPLYIFCNVCLVSHTMWDQYMREMMSSSLSCIHIPIVTHMHNTHVYKCVSNIHTYIQYKKKMQYKRTYIGLYTYFHIHNWYIHVYVYTRAHLANVWFLIYADTASLS